MGSVYCEEEVSAETQAAIYRFLRFEVGFIELISAYRRAMRSHRDTVEDPHSATLALLARLDDLDSTLSVDDLTAYVEAEADAAMAVVRQAFLVSLFHFWERQVLTWSGRERYDHAAAMSWLGSNGGAPDAQLLRRLELACHVAKHGPGSSSQKLLALEPDHFRASDDADGECVLEITDDQVESYFHAVFKSAPRTPQIDR